MEKSIENNTHLGPNSLMPFFVVKKAAPLLEFIEKVFGGKEIKRISMPDGRVVKAEIKIGDSTVLLGETLGNHPPIQSMVYLYVDDADLSYKKALEAGAISLRAPSGEEQSTDQNNNQDEARSATVMGPGGNIWWMATRKKSSLEASRTTDEAGQ
jgi:PhnB protein